VRSTQLADGVRLDAAELDVENTGLRVIQVMQVRLRTRGISEDLVWLREVVQPGERRVVSVPAENWSQVVPRSKAFKFEIGIAAVRFEGESFPQESAEKAPTPAPTPSARSAPRSSHTTGGRTPAPPAMDSSPEPYTGTGERVPASVLNPPGAPVVITEAWVPRDPPPPSKSEAERSMDRGHDVTWTPGLSLHNTSSHRVVGLRLRFKADAQSHAVTGFDEPIEPGQTLVVPPRRSMWGKPDAMTVQVLGVQFEDGTTWGSLESTIDTRQGWIR
jgi:hypothetical protein